MRGGDAWLHKLLRDSDPDLRLAAVRIIEVRKAYATGEEEFDWDALKLETALSIEKGNKALMQGYMEDKLSIE